MIVSMQDYWVVALSLIIFLEPEENGNSEKQTRENSSVAGVGICTPSSSAVQAVHSNPTEHSRFVCRLVTFFTHA